MYICVCVCVCEREREIQREKERESAHNLVYAIPCTRSIQQVISQVSQPFHIPSCNKQTTSKNVVTSSKKQAAFLFQRSVG